MNKENLSENKRIFAAFINKFFIFYGSIEDV